MRYRIAALVAVASFMLAVPVMAHAVTIHQHQTVVHHTVVGHDAHGPVRVAQPVIVTRVVRLIPVDTDEDGIADTEDNCPNTASTVNGGCPPPAPPPITTTTVATAPAATGVCPASLAGESGSPTAVNPTSGAAGCIQAIPETWDQYGDPAYAEASDAPVSVQLEAMAAICAAQGNDAWDAADPC